MIGIKITPQRYIHFLIVEPVKITLYGKGRGNCEVLERNLSWIIQVGPICQRMYPYKKDGEGDLTEI